MSGCFVPQTATTLIFAYLAYFTTEIVFHCSGIIGVLTYGLTINALGKNTINDRKLVDDFWTLVEFFLNTVLFTLGGLVSNRYWCLWPLLPQFADSIVFLGVGQHHQQWRS